MCKDEATNVLIAISAGIVLAVMTDWNSQLARYSSPLFASWTAHGVGTLSSLVLAGIFIRAAGSKAKAGYSGGAMAALVLSWRHPAPLSSCLPH